MTINRKQKVYDLKDYFTETDVEVKQIFRSLYFYLHIIL